MFKHIFSFLNSLLGWLLLSFILSAFLYFLASVALIFVGIPVLDLCCSKDAMDASVYMWEVHGPYLFFGIAVTIVMVDEKITPIFFRKRRLAAQQEDTASHDRTS